MDQMRSTQDISLVTLVKMKQTVPKAKVKATAYYTDPLSQYSENEKWPKLWMICFASSIFDNIIKNKK